MPGHLNSFQRTMLDWNALHPYNAIHGVYIAANFDLNRLRSVIATTLGSLGLTNLALDADHRTYEFHGGTTTSDINVLATGGDAGATMATETSAASSSRAIRVIIVPLGPRRSGASATASALRTASFVPRAQNTGIAGDCARTLDSSRAGDGNICRGP